jgi:hypothetical protein
MTFPIYGKTKNVPNHQPGIINPVDEIPPTGILVTCIGSCSRTASKMWGTEKNAYDPQNHMCPYIRTTYENWMQANL